MKLASPVNLASCCDAALVRSIFPLLEIYLDAKDISNFLWNRNKSESVLKSLSLRIMLVTHFKIRMNKSNSVLNFVHKSRHFCEGVTKIDVTFFNIRKSLVLLQNLSQNDNTFFPSWTSCFLIKMFPWCLSLIKVQKRGMIKSANSRLTVKQRQKMMLVIVTVSSSIVATQKKSNQSVFFINHKLHIILKKSHKWKKVFCYIGFTELFWFDFLLSLIGPKKSY